MVYGFAALAVLILAAQTLILWRQRKMSAATDQLTAALGQLQTDVTALVAQGSAGNQAAVDALAQQTTIAVQSIDASVKAALTPAPTA